jgi:hypothetical protein
MTIDSVESRNPSERLQTEPPTQNPSMWKRIGLIAAEVVLVLLTLAMIAAILLPVFKGTSSDLRSSDPFSAPGRRR